MPANSEAAELYAVIKDSALQLDVQYSHDKVWPILSAYGDAFAHDEAVVAFRVATGARHVGELDCRFRTHPDTGDPYAFARSNGITPETDHPVGSLLREVQGQCAIDSHGIDFGVVRGFKKVYAAFTPDSLQRVSSLAEMPSMPRSLAENAEFFGRYGLDDKIGVIGIDYPHRTVNVYFNDVPAECFEPKTILAMLREIGTVEPSDQMLRLGQESFGLYVTLNWDFSKVERICYAVTTTDLKTLPVRIEPEVEKFVRSVPYDGGDAKYVYGVALAPEGEYYKLESHYRWKPGAINFV